MRDELPRMCTGDGSVSALSSVFICALSDSYVSIGWILMGVYSLEIDIAELPKEVYL